MRKALYLLVGTLALTPVAPAALVIDDFTSGGFAAQSCAPPTGQTNTAGPGVATNTVSGERRVSTVADALLAVPSGCITASTNFPSATGLFNIISDDGVFGTTTVTWDIPGVVDITGLDLFRIGIAVSGSISPNDTVNLTIMLCSDDACSNRYERAWSITGTLAATTQTLALSSFSTIGAPLVTSITKAALTVVGANSSDLQIDNLLLDTSAPEPSTMALLGSALLGLALLRRRG